MGTVLWVQPVAQGLYLTFMFTAVLLANSTIGDICRYMYACWWDSRRLVSNLQSSGSNGLNNVTSISIASSSATAALPTGGSCLL